MVTPREIAKRLPVVPFVYRTLRDWYSRYRLKFKSTEAVFTGIYKTNAWGHQDSVSGEGSSTRQTRVIAAELPSLFAALKISTILDIPCGDFHWMKDVDLARLDYTGADIVKDLIETNRSKYAGERRRFQSMNLIQDRLPRVDLILCRDCLVHLSGAEILLALRNICDSQSEYLLTTTFTDRTHNADIVAGQWRVINLELAPFWLPKPLRVVNEGCTEGNGAFQDKALGLWKVSEIRESLAGGQRRPGG